ncbi:MAG TPA: YihY/virulence factor BrkB family protein [Bryobacteraceae bacterium]|nr:YihY/virulence factor BrkB family protein [Bryobacteraceae bacterium]
MVPSFLSGEQHPYWSRFRPTLRYLGETEAHVYALAIAASVLLSFYPFIIVMLSFCRNVLHWRAAEAAIYLALNDSLPGDVGEFVRRNLPARGSVQVTSMILLLVTANGVFEPLEVALNRCWGVARNRSYVRNQLVALGMIFACGGLALLSFMLTALNQSWMADFGSHAALQNWLNLLIFKIAALPISILALFLVYWLLPNRKIDPARVAPAAILVGLALEAMKYVNLLVFPLFREKLQREYGVFQHSVAILLWSFVASLAVLAGAEWSARSAMMEKK